MGSESTERHATSWEVDLPASARGDQLPTHLCPCTGFQVLYSIVAYASWGIFFWTLQRSEGYSLFISASVNRRTLERNDDNPGGEPGEKKMLDYMCYTIFCTW